MSVSVGLVSGLCFCKERSYHRLHGASKPGDYKLLMELSPGSGLAVPPLNWKNFTVCTRMSHPQLLLGLLALNLECVTSFF